MTGMRRGEALGLRWKDIDLEGVRLSVRQAVVSVAYVVLNSTPKSHQARVIDLDPRTVEQLRAHYAAQQLERAMGLGLLRAGSRGGQGERPADPPGQLQPGVPAAGQERGPPPNPAARPPPYARDARSQGRRTPEGEQRAPGTRVAHVHTEAVRARDPRDAGEAASQIASLVSGAAGSSASFRT